jgi:hypothetical protein
MGSETGRRRAGIAIDPSLDYLIDRSGDLKGELISYAEGPRFRRWFDQMLLEAAGPDGVLDQATAIRAVDDFVFGYRLPDGGTIIDSFVWHRRDLPAAERDMLLGWREPVDGIFEIRRKHKDSLTLLNLIDDMEYRTYSNMGPSVFRSLPAGGFTVGRLVPVADSWVVSGMLESYARSGARDMAKIALEMATQYPRAVFRNPEKIEQGWAAMRRNREEFIDFFGSDEVILPPAEAEERLTEQMQRHQQAAIERSRSRPSRLAAMEAPAFTLPETLFAFDTIAIIFDEVDGLNFYPD